MMSAKVAAPTSSRPSATCAGASPPTATRMNRKLDPHIRASAPNLIAVPRPVVPCAMRRSLLRVLPSEQTPRADVNTEETPEHTFA